MSWFTQLATSTPAGSLPCSIAIFRISSSISASTRNFTLWLIHAGVVPDEFENKNFPTLTFCALSRIESRSSVARRAEAPCDSCPSCVQPVSSITLEEYRTQVWRRRQPRSGASLRESKVCKLGCMDITFVQRHATAQSIQHLSEFGCAVPFHL